MKNIFKNISNSVIALSVVALIFGVILILYPGLSLVALGITAAVFLVAHGITLIVLDIKARKFYIPFDGMMQGILYIILGILLAIVPESLAMYIGISLGLWIIASGVNGIKLAMALRGTDAPWILMTILNIIDIIAGIAVLLTPIFSAVSVTVCAGVVIIVHAVINISKMISVKKNVKNLERTIIEKIR